MFHVTHSQMSYRIFGISSLPRIRNLNTGNLHRTSPPKVQHLNDLPSAKKFLGLVDWEFIKSPTKRHIIFSERAKKFGDMYVLQPFFFSGKILVVNTPALVKEMSSKEGIMPERGVLGFEVLKKIRKEANLKAGVIISDGPEWKRFREPVSKRLLRPKSLSHYIPEFSNIAREAVDDIIEINQKDNLKYDSIVDRIDLWTLSSFYYFMFHRYLSNNSEIDKYIQTIKFIISSFGSPKWQNPRYRFFQSKYWDEVVENYRNLNEFTRQNLMESISTTKDVNNEGALLEYLQSQTDFDDIDIVTTFVDFLGAAVDTTSVSTQWLWYNLSKNPRVQDKLYEEVMSVVGDSPVITVDHFNKLHYMKMCMKESMRVTPSITAWFRYLREAGQLGGVEMPKEVPVVGNVYYIQLNERYWKNPKDFIPERWEKRSEIDPFSYIPFGTGPRMCVGRRIAEAEMQLATAHLCRKARVHLKREPDPALQVMVHPKGLELSFEER